MAEKNSSCVKKGVLSQLPAVKQNTILLQLDSFFGPSYSVMTLEAFIFLLVASAVEFWQPEYSVNKKQTKRIVNNNGTGNNSQTTENTGAENTTKIFRKAKLKGHNKC